MTKYKGIIFDLDGTLLNTINDLANSVNEVMEHYEFPTHDCQAYKLKIGRGFKNLIQRSVPENMRDNEEFLQEAVDLFVKIYDRRYKECTVPYDGIPELIEQLHKRGIPLAVNSNKRTDYTNALVEKFFSHIPFVAVYGEREGIPKKPNPAAALEIAEIMKLSPEEILYIGDSKTDMETGNNAGMDTVGVDWGFRGRKELEANGGTYIVERPEEILNII